MTRRPHLVILLAVLTLAGCTTGTSSGSATYVSVSQSSATIVSWTDDGSGHLTGSVHAAASTSTNGDAITSANASVTGNLHDGQVSLVVNKGLGVTSTWSGSLSVAGLTLNISKDDGTIDAVTLVGGTIRDYNSAVSALRNRSAHLATSATTDWRVTKYTLTYTLQRDGSVRVATDLDFDFGRTPGHGPMISVPTRQATTDAGGTRDLPVSGITASSSTGAPAAVNQEIDGNELVLKIGDPNRGDITGNQSYHIEYTVGAVINRFSDHVEFYWNVVSPGGWTLPRAGVTVHVTGPAPANGGMCFAGLAGSTTACDSAAVNQSGSYTFTQASIYQGKGLTVVVRYPAATFPD